MNTFLIDDRVWIIDKKNDTRHPGVVVAINHSDNTVSVRLEDGSRYRVYVGVVTLRESHE